jgi:hypothetical protein
MSNRKPLIVDSSRRKSEIPSQDDLLLVGGSLVKNGVSSGSTVTVPAGYTLIVHGPYEVEGDLVLEGDILIL